LKDELLTFEDAWRNKVKAENGAKGAPLAQPFVDALAASDARARAVARKEKAAFFATYVSSADILKAASSAADDLTKARDALLAAARAAPKHDDLIKAATLALADATLTLAVKEGVWKDLDARVADKKDPTLLKAQAEHMTALAAKLEAEHRLQNL
jgi:hypothetical protein